MTRNFLENPSSMPESYKVVLMCIVKKGPQIKYEIEKETKVNRATVYKAVERFVAAGALEARKIGVARTGLQITRYDLTLLGLCMALDISPTRHYGVILNKWGHLDPVLLGRWEYFFNKVGEEQATQNLFQAAYVALKSVSKKEDFPQKAVQELFEYFEQKILYPKVEGRERLNQQLVFDKEQLKKWAEAFRGDPKLKRLAVNYVKQKAEIFWAGVGFITDLEKEILGKVVY